MQELAQWLMTANGTDTADTTDDDSNDSTDGDADD